jgi:hypothetical protein
MNRLQIKSLISNFLFFVFIIMLMLSVILFGFHPTDHEFISSLSYRVYLGQLPYIDFDFVRPPLSLYLHSISFHLFPENAILFSRVVFFFEMVLISFLSIKTLKDNLHIKHKETKWYFLILLILTLHNFPAMPWHTVDGILFSVISIYYFSLGLNKNNNLFFIISGAFCALSPLFKQNFLIIPFFIIISIFLINNKKSKYVIIGILLIWLSFYSFLRINDLIIPFLESKSSGATFKNIIFSLINGLRVESTYIILPFILLISISQFLVKINILKKRQSILILILIFSFLNIFEVYFLELKTIPVLFYQSIFVSSIFIFFRKINSMKDIINPNNLIMILLIIISITSMISWGYPYPILYIIPHLLIILKELNEMVRIKIRTLFLGSFIFWILTSNVLYRDSYKVLATNNLGSVFSKLKYIYVGDENLTLYKNIKELSDNYDVETVIPEFPLYNYLFDKNSSFKIDWFLDVESTRNPEEYLENMDNKFFIIRKTSEEEDIFNPKRLKVISLIKENSDFIKSKDNLSLYKFNGFDLRNSPSLK